MGNALYRGEPPAGNGDVRLLVTVLADGTLENIRVLQSSGISELDQAAQDTVVLSAPFPAFSRELAQHTPRLDIIRTWQFRTHAVRSANTTPE
jgi:protein TonB